MDWDFEKLKDQLEKLNAEQSLSMAQEDLEAIELDDIEEDEEDIAEDGIEEDGISDGERETQEAVLKMLDELLQELE